MSGSGSAAASADPGPAWTQSWKIDPETGRAVYVPDPESGRALRAGDIMLTPDGALVCTSVMEPATWTPADELAGREMCGTCGERPPHHTAGKAGEEPRRLCCACSYAETGCAADWHPGCVAAAEAARAAKGGNRP